MRVPLLVVALAAAAPLAARGDEGAGDEGSGEAAPPGVEALRVERALSPGGDGTVDVGEPEALARGGLKEVLPRWGLAVGAGFPDFATASVVFRPLAPVRVHVGPSWNTLGWGLQGGITLVPWTARVAPLVSFGAGRFFANDLSFAADGEDGAAMRPLLDDVSYSYATADVGLELGNPRGLCFTLRLGLAYVAVAAHGTASRAEDGGTVSLSDPSVNATLPSLKLGLQYWF